MVIIWVELLWYFLFHHIHLRIINSSFGSFNLLEHVVPLHRVNHRCILILHIEKLRILLLLLLWYTLIFFVIRITSWFSVVLGLMMVVVMMAVEKSVQVWWVVKSMWQNRFHLLVVVPVNSHLIWIPLKTLSMLLALTEQLLPTNYRAIKLMLDYALF